MTDASEVKRGPLVTVLLPTFNRRAYLGEAIESLMRQVYPHFEAFVVNDGGHGVRDIVESFNDPRLVLIDRRENRGKAASLNEALCRARGKYVAYLDDDDRFYPQHLARLVETLEKRDQCGAAYTDLYKVHCRIRPDGSRQVLGKIVTISRDFDRFFICYFNHALHVSLAHRRDLLEKTGLYNESLRVLIDWDMTRRLAFFTDFQHVPEVTGEFYGPVGASDRISYRQRLDKEQYLKQVMTIRTTRPPKPWPRMPDLSIVFLPDALDPSSGDVLRNIWLWTFMPCRIYLPLPAGQLARLTTEMTHLVRVPVPEGSPRHARIDEALRQADGDYVAVATMDVRPGCLWVEDALHAAVLAGQGGSAFAIAEPSGDCPPVLLRADDLRRARAGREHLTLRESLDAAGIAIRVPEEKERALLFDRLFQEAQGLQRDGNWAQAAWIYGQVPAHFANGRWMRELAAWALYRAGKRDARAMEACRDINSRQPTVSTLLLEAKLLKRANRTEEAANLLEAAEQILSGKV